MIDPNCIFCKIVNNEIPSDKIYEDDNFVAFLDISPVSKGHAIVIPKTHSPHILETEEAVLAEIIKKVKIIAEAIQRATDADGFNISVNTGVAAGQTVFHLHFHIIPRFASDGLKPWAHRDSEPKSRADMAAAIKKHL